jgi:hypothetical protein
MFLFCFTKILNQASFYMTHPFDSEVSLHYWLFWPTVRRGGSVVLAGTNSHKKQPCPQTRVQDVGFNEFIFF